MQETKGVRCKTKGLARSILLRLTNGYPRLYTRFYGFRSSFYKEDVDANVRTHERCFFSLDYRILFRVVYLSGWRTRSLSREVEGCTRRSVVKGVPPHFEVCSLVVVVLRHQRKTFTVETCNKTDEMSHGCFNSFFFQLITVPVSIVNNKLEEGSETWSYSYRLPSLVSVVLLFSLY